MADWDRTDVFSLASPMHPPPFMWKGAGDTYDVEKEKGVIREHYDKAVGVLNEGAGYDTLRGMMDRLEAHHNRAKEAASGYESRRNYARLQSAVMRESVISIARERVEREDDEAVEEEANQILDEPMGAHAETLIGDGVDAVWRTPWSSFEDKESTLKDINIHFNPENNSNYKVQFEEDDLHRTDQRVFDGDETWRGALESIHQRWEHLEEQHERAGNTKELLRFRLGVIETVLYRFEAYGSVEEMTEEEAQEIVSEQGEVVSPIPGYRGAEYAIEAKQVLKEMPITTFSALNREMEEATVGGESKVDTVKRNIGYDDLPKEEKKFPRFREMLKKKVDQLQGED
jgi:hypothetical protein